MSAGTIWQKRFASGGDLVAATLWQYIGGASVMLWPRLLEHTVIVNGELIFAMAWLVCWLSTPSSC
jgi:hypothetical protein